MAAILRCHDNNSIPDGTNDSPPRPQLRQPRRPRRRMRTASGLRIAVVVWALAVGHTATAFVPPQHQTRGSAMERCAASNNNNNLDKGFNLLEVASRVVPQGRIVKTAKESWGFLWKRFMVELAPQDKTGNYQRPSYGFSGTLGSTKHPAEGNGRYHVYVGNPCPWCHRVSLVAGVLGLAEPSADGGNAPLLGLTRLVDDPVKASRGGWIFAEPPPQAPAVKDLRELYELLSPGYTGRCTAPLLVDWKTRTIVSNESKDIVRMLPLLLQRETTATEKDHPPPLDLCPAGLQATIDETNEWVYRLVNNGVYRCGFATSQAAYERASADVVEGLGRCEAILSEQDYLCGDAPTESDLLLLPTLLRFDGVYAPLFGATGTHARLELDYPATFAYLRRCWGELPGVRASIDLPDACASYYKQLFPLNPGGILPSPPITAARLRLE